MFSIVIADVFDEVAALLLLAAVIGAVALRLRQPLIVGFIAVGILVGPSGFGWVQAADQIHLLAELGLALLLFVVGLKLDISLIRSMGPVALATGLGQVLFTSIFGYFIALGLGLPSLSALYVAVALTFSSTIIIVKLLSDKRETDTLHGRIAVGFLIVQDIMVVIAMIVLAGMGVNGTRDLDLQILLMVVKGAGLLSALGLLMYFVLPWLLGKLARSSELLVLFGIAWAVLLANLSETLGFSKEVGAFLAGVSLASTAYREVLAARLVSLRDFLLLFFFIELGSRLDLGLIGAQVWFAIPLSLFVLIGNPLIVMVIMGAMGYRKRTSFLAGLTVAQISEFSLILVAMGMNLGHIGTEEVGLVTLVGLITIGLSTYMILYSHALYEKLSPYLNIFQRQVTHRERVGDAGHAPSADIVIYGLGRFGSSIAHDLIEQGRSVLGVDIDPHAVRRWNKRGWKARYGDAEDPEFPSTLPLSSAKWVVSSVRDIIVNSVLIQSLCSHGYRGIIAVTAHNSSDSKALSERGADVVFIPYRDAAARAVNIITEVEQQEARKKMNKLIASLKDHFIVCGYGRMGKQIVKDFLANNVPFVVIESNPEQIPYLIEGNIPHVEGKATEDEVLTQAGIDRAKGLVAVTATDEENVFIVLTARGMNPRLYIVARSIQEENEDKLRRAGADEVLSPYVLGGHRIAAAVLKPKIMDFLDLVVHSQDFHLDIATIEVSQSAAFVDLPLEETSLRKKAGITILAVGRTGEELHPNPAPDYVIRPGDELTVMGAPDQIETARRLAAGG